MTSLKGKLLIASPALVDPNFARAVVLIAEHSEDGTLGLVLNRLPKGDGGSYGDYRYEYVNDSERGRIKERRRTSAQPRRPKQGLPSKPGMPSAPGWLSALSRAALERRRAGRP